MCFGIETSLALYYQHFPCFFTLAEIPLASIKPTVLRKFCFFTVSNLRFNWSKVLRYLNLNIVLIYCVNYEV